MMKPINDHLQAEELFSAYIDNRVTADEKSFVERHTAACADCYAKLQTDRSLVAAMRAMPMVKAPRSFVLPREMARQPHRSILAWYPALRLATALAVVALVLVFAGDLFTGSYGSSVNMPMAVPQAAMMAATAVSATVNKEVVVTQEVAVAAPTAAPVAIAAPKVTADQTMTAEGTSPAALRAAPPMPTATSSAPAGGAVAPSVPGPLMITNTGEATVVPSTPALPSGLANDQANSSAATEVALNQPTPTTEPAGAVSTAAPASVPVTPIDPLRPIEIVLGGLVIVLGVATLIARQRAS